MEGKVVYSFLSWTLVDEIPFDHQKYFIELFIDLSIGLMDGHENGFSFFRYQLLEIPNNDVGSE